MTNGVPKFPARMMTMQGDEMLQAEEVAAILRLHELGWGAKRLSKEFGCARNTVRRNLRAHIALKTAALAKHEPNNIKQSARLEPEVRLLAFFDALWQASAARSEVSLLPKRFEPLARHRLDRVAQRGHG